MRATARGFGLRAALCFAAVLVVLGFAERGAHVLVSRRLAIAGAQWIWSSGALERSEPVTFYAVRDFELDPVPAAVHVQLLADEAYVVYLNGVRVGSGAYFAGAPLDSYRVERLLKPGWNRLAIELRSERGAGGLLCAVVEDGKRTPLVVSDDAWRVFHDASGVIEGMRDAGAGQPALVWQSPPTGGWGLPSVDPDRPLYQDAIATAAGRLDAAPLEPQVAPRPTTEAGAPLVNDFGKPVSGYVVLRGLAAAPRRLLIQIGLEREGGSIVDVVMADGQTSWSTTEARPLRYVGSPYLPDGATLGVVEVTPALSTRDAERATQRGRGVFGVEPPRRDQHQDDQH
jgi:hypothetical protein